MTTTLQKAVMVCGNVAAIGAITGGLGLCFYADDYKKSSRFMSLTGISVIIMVSALVARNIMN